MLLYKVLSLAGRIRKSSEHFRDYSEALDYAYKQSNTYGYHVVVLSMDEETLKWKKIHEILASEVC